METEGTGVVPAKGGLCKCCPARYCIGIMLCIGMGLIYGHKVALHVAIVAMVNHTAVGIQHPAPNTTNPCGSGSGVKATADGPFVWEHSVEGYLLSSYFYGYMVSEIPGGMISEQFSAKWVFFGAVFANILAHLCAPTFSQLHWGALLALRIIQGMGGGMTFPAAHCLLAQWAPPLELSFIGTLVYAGTCLGTVVFMLISGVIADQLGWQAVFYIEGSLSTIWLLAWGLLSADSPNKMKRISPEERAYIVDSLKENTQHERKGTPWKKVFTSKPFWAILIAHTCSNWGWYMVLVELPQYMVHALGFNMKDNALLSAMPFFIMWIFSTILSKVLGVLRAKDIISMTWLRKIATLIASVIPACCLLVLCFIQCDKILAVVMMTVAITAIGGMYTGFLSNHIDIAPNYAGTLMAITNTIATIPGIAVPIMVGQLTERDPSVTSWRLVFIVTIVLYIVEIVVFTIFGSGEVQDWN